MTTDRMSKTDRRYRMYREADANGRATLPDHDANDPERNWDFLLFDHLVRTQDRLGRDFMADCLRSLENNDGLKSSWQKHGQVCGLATADIVPSLTIYEATSGSLLQRQEQFP